MVLATNGGSSGEEKAARNWAGGRQRVKHGGSSRRVCEKAERKKKERNAEESRSGSSEGAKMARSGPVRMKLAMMGRRL